MSQTLWHCCGIPESAGLAEPLFPEALFSRNPLLSPQPFPSSKAGLPSLWLLSYTCLENVLRLTELLTGGAGNEEVSAVMSGVAGHPPAGGCAGNSALTNADAYFLFCGASMNEPDLLLTKSNAVKISGSHTA